jgi:hypothetical protein
MLPPEAIQEFKQIYRNKFGEELSDAEATRRANRLVNLYGAIFEHLIAQPEEKVKTHAA